MKITRRIYFAAVGALVSLSGAGIVVLYVMAMLANAPSMTRLAQLTGAPVRTAAETSPGPSWWQKLAQQSQKIFARAPAVPGDGVLMVTPKDRQDMRGHFAALDYIMPAKGATPPDNVVVPRLYLSSLPDDLAMGDSSWERKHDFIKVMLPLILAGNEKILSERLRAQRLEQHIHQGGDLYAVNRMWVIKLAERYGMPDFDPAGGDWAELFQRVDIVPPSLALAQAAKESGWGTSRFARQGNAVFGQWSWKRGSGIIPAARVAQAEHEVRRFDHLSESVSAYLFNLNTHNYYDQFRKRRAEAHKQGQKASGFELTRYLKRYSADGDKYISDLREIIETNLLKYLDAAQLRPANINGLSSS